MSNSAPEAEEKPPKRNWGVVQWTILGVELGAICALITFILFIICGSSPRARDELRLIGKVAQAWLLFVGIIAALSGWAGWFFSKKPVKSVWSILGWSMLGTLLGIVYIFIFFVFGPPLLSPFIQFIGWFFWIFLLAFIILGRVVDRLVTSRLRTETDHPEKLNGGKKNFFKRLFPRKIRLGMGRVLFLAVYAYLFFGISLSAFVHWQMWTTPQASFNANQSVAQFYYLDQFRVGLTTYHLVGYPRTNFISIYSMDDFTNGRGGIISNLPVILSVYECHFGGLWCGITYISQQTLSFNGTNICIPCVVYLTYDEKTGQVSLRSPAGHKEFVPDGQ